MRFIAMTPQRADGADFVIRAERSAQQPDGMQVLNPLAICNIRLPTGYIFDVMRINQPFFNLPFLKNLKQRNPIHTGGFHGHGSNLALLKPIGQPFQIDSKC